MTGKPQKHEFEAEVTKLLDIVIHSLYSNKDVFLRELISNSSDALDKVRFEGLTNADLLPKEDLAITLERNTEIRTLSISDNGIGMSRDEVLQNIGTIAKSGTAEFLEMVKNSKANLDADLIGQFGVGFYSSFMVADRVTVVTRRANEPTATQWESAGQGWYTITETERDLPGTTVTLHLKSVDGDNGIKDYTDEWVIREIVKKYSDFVTYPIRMEVTQTETEKDDDGSDKPDSARNVQRVQTLNSMKAIWTKPKSDVTDEEYRDFYQHITHDWSEPLTHIAAKMEGGVEARALIYIPSRAPMDLYHREFSYRGLQLYAKRVFILDECRDLMPLHLRFVKGVVDAEDISLNVSRELLQQDRQITAIRKFLVRKVMDTLSTMQRDEAEKYRTFWAQFGPVLKEGLLGWDEKKDTILDLVLAHSTQGDKLTSLAEYVGRMKADQKQIYYLVGTNLQTVRKSPHVEAFVDKGFEVLFFSDPVDEVWLQQPSDYQGHSWQSVSRGDTALDETDSGEKVEAFKDLLTALQSHVSDYIKEIRLSHRLTSSAACLVGDKDDIPPQLAEMLRRSGQEVPTSKRILELNPDHEILKRLQSRFDADASDPIVGDYANLLYGQAVLAEGGELDDPAGFSKRLATLMERGL